MRNLDLTRDVWKFAGDLDAKRYKQVVHKMLSLPAGPVPTDSQTLKGSDQRRYDVGEYRIVCSFDTDTVKIIVIGKRNDDQVYRDLKRKQ